jgi:hypothetical protein
MEIWYVFLRSDLSYQGSGITKFDDATCGSTLTPVCEYDDMSEAAYYDVNTGTWSARSTL